jgi:hypothetical protein
MTFAEIILVLAGGLGLYFGLRPLQRRLEVFLLEKFFGRRRRLSRPTLDVTAFTSYKSHKKEDHEHRS